MTEIEFFGIVISRGGFKPTPEKVEVIFVFSEPKNLKELKRFLGMAGFYHRFIKNFLGIADPLTDLTRGVQGKYTVPVTLNSAALKAFNELKEVLKKASLTLAFPEPGAQIELTTDASELAAGAVLQHIATNGEKSPLSFFHENFQKPSHEDQPSTSNSLQHFSA